MRLRNDSDTHLAGFAAKSCGGGGSWILVWWIEGADLSEKSKNGTPRGSLAFAFLTKIHWWYGIVWAGLAIWVVVRWGFEGY